MPAPRFNDLNVFEVDDEDRLWTVRCNPAMVADLFESPEKWLSELTVHRRNLQSGHP